MSLKSARMLTLADQLDSEEEELASERKKEEAKIKASKKPSPKKLKDDK